MNAEEMSRYLITGPRGEGPYVVEAVNGLDAAAKVQSFPMQARGGRYSLEQPRGRNGHVLGYESSGQAGVVSKVGAFDITWLPPAAWEDHPLTTD